MQGEGGGARAVQGEGGGLTQRWDAEYGWEDDATSAGEGAASGAGVEGGAASSAGCGREA